MEGGKELFRGKYSNIAVTRKKIVGVDSDQGRRGRKKALLRCGKEDKGRSIYLDFSLCLTVKVPHHRRSLGKQDEKALAR